jgi:transmembrane sensor
MERSNQINELIARYLINDLNDEEHALVVDWINSSEENRRYFINIKDTWQLTAVKLTEQVNEEEEWRQFSNTLAARDAAVLSMNEQETSGNEFVEEAYTHRKGILYRRLLQFAAAAAVILAIGLGWAYYFNKSDQQQIIVRHTENKKESNTDVVQREVNTTGAEKRITLADGSLVVLFNNSEIVYEKQFIRRHIKLAGKAFFSVAKNAGRPFTVESGAIATTALGTEFTVTAFANAKQLSVRLYEGKVVIKPTVQNNRIVKQATILIPGQEFIYGPNSTTVRTFRANSQSPNVRQEETSATDDPSLPMNTKGSWHMYNNQALSQVLDHLAATYGVMIVYEAKDVQQKYFVGQFKTTDSIEMILKLITKANKLKYTREDNTYIIHQ